ncbi:MAG: hypothetical protein HWE34_04095 [Methylocystaceae bacterium]|nr:hypothetical protein [Methylocystaceae bacterium]
MLFRILLAILLFSPNIVAADYPKETISAWRIIESPKKRTTSSCIGEMSSPICIADTMVACGAWKHPHGQVINEDDDQTWIDGYPPMCDQLRLKPGNSEYPVYTFDVWARNADFVSIRYRIATAPVIDDLFFELTHKNRENYYNEYKYDDDYIPSDDLETRENFWDIKMGDTVMMIDAIVCVPPEKARLPVDNPENGTFLYKNDAPLSNCGRLYSETDLYNAAIVRETTPGQWQIITGDMKPYRDLVDPYLLDLAKRLRNMRDR